MACEALEIFGQSDSLKEPGLIKNQVWLGYRSFRESGKWLRSVKK
jgi:hypothetical protein